MQGNTGGQAQQDSLTKQVQQDRFYPQDVYVCATEEVSAYSWMFRSSTDAIQLLTGNSYQSPRFNADLDQTVTIQYNQHQQHQPHKPEDNRPSKHRRRERRRYKKAKAHYGKTYIITRNQMMFGLAVAVGTVLILSVLLFQFYVWFAQLAGAI